MGKLSSMVQDMVADEEEGMFTLINYKNENSLSDTSKKGLNVNQLHFLHRAVSIVRRSIESSKKPSRFIHVFNQSNKTDPSNGTFEQLETDSQRSQDAIFIFRNFTFFASS